MLDDPLLQVEELTKYYPVRPNFFGRPTAHVRAVDGVSLTISRGEIVSLVGESGCGKTTMGRCILRLEAATNGRIFFEGQDVLKCSPADMRRIRQNMQTVFQDPYASLNPRKTVGHIIGDAFTIHGLLKKAEKQDRVLELLDIVGMRAEHAKRYPHEFSGGQRQRIGVARALALNPKLVVADEPVSALDVSVQAQILNLLVDLRARLNLTYLFISHDLSVVRHISDRVAVMYLGRIVELGHCHNLFAGPRHPYTRALISAVPIADRRRTSRRIVLQGDVPSPINPPPGCHFHLRCLYQQTECKQSIPKFREIAPDHWVACHYPLSVSHSPPGDGSHPH